MSEESVSIELADLRLICLAARRALYHSAHSDAGQDTWLAEEFLNYVGKSREVVLEVLEKYDPVLAEYREQEFKRYQQRRQLAREQEEATALAQLAPEPE